MYKQFEDKLSGISVDKFGKSLKALDKEEVLIRQLGIQDKYSSIQLLALGEDVLTPEKARELVQKVLKNGDDKNNLFTIIV